MTTTTSFPILHLPTKSLKHAICSLTPEELIKFSLVSKSTKRAAESLNLQKHIYAIKIDEIVSVNVECNLIKWNPLEVDLRTLIDHTQCVFHTNEVCLLMIRNDNHDWISIHKALDGLNCSRTSLEVQSQNIWLQRIANQFSSRSLELFLSKSTWYHSILSSHRLNLSLFDSSTDVSCVNCEHLNIYYTMSSRAVNLFLKHWMRGEYKSLKSLNGYVEPEVSADEIFKDVEYQETEIAKTVIEWNWVIRDIYRFDGTRATFVLKYGYVTFDVLN